MDATRKENDTIELHTSMRFLKSSELCEQNKWRTTGYGITNDSLL